VPDELENAEVAGTEPGSEVDEAGTQARHAGPADGCLRPWRTPAVQHRLLLACSRKNNTKIH
jgi:hypothetical protein